MTQFFITLCILPLSCRLSIALGWDNTRKLEERQKGNHDRNPLSENISEKLHFPISQFPASAPFAARDFLDCPNHLPKVGKVKVSDFSAVLDLKILQPNFKTRLTYIRMVN